MAGLSSSAIVGFISSGIKMGEKIGEKCQKEPFSGENGGFSIAF